MTEPVEADDVPEHQTYFDRGGVEHIWVERTQDWKHTNSTRCTDATCPGNWPYGGVARTPDQLVAEFHEVFGVGAEDYPDIATQSDTTIEMRCQLILEEAQEAVDAIRARDLVGAAKELADLAYVTYGAARRFGIPLDAVVAEVHWSNMTKLDDDGKPLFREDGKVLKGPNYQPPDILRVLQDASETQGSLDALSPE